MYFTPKPEPHNSADLACTIMVLSKGTMAGGKKFWAYLYIKSNMAKAFKEAEKKGNFDLEEYGTILEWGEGESPPEEVVERMKRNYGMRADYEEMLLKAIEQFT